MYSIIFYMNFELVFRHSDRGALGTPDSPCICINRGTLGIPGSPCICINRGALGTPDSLCICVNRGALGSPYIRVNYMHSRFPFICINLGTPDSPCICINRGVLDALSAPAIRVYPP